MKTLNTILVVVAVIAMVLGLISRLSLKPISGIESRAMFDFSSAILLLVIALAVSKDKA